MRQPISSWAAAAALALASAVCSAAVPHDKAVPAYAEEQTILQLEQGRPEPGLGSAASGREHLDRHTVVPPGRLPEYDVILQRGGNTWRTLRNGPLSLAVGVLLAATVLAIALFHRFVGPADPAPAGPASERRLLRFTRWDRWVHWAAAIDFVLLAVTGLLLLFGKKALLPLIGHDAFSWVAAASKWLHNVGGPLFVVLNLLMFLTFWRRNVFRRADWPWLKRLGGMFSHEHVPAPFFNAGEKLWFWFGVTLLGLATAATGLMLDFPYGGEVGAAWGLTRYQLQWAATLHLVCACSYLLMGIGHTYLGTLGVSGAWGAMRDGTVSASWARQHHELWYDEAVHGARHDAADDAGRIGRAGTAAAGAP